MIKKEIQIKNFKWIDLTLPKSTDLHHLSNELSIPNRILTNAIDPEHLPKYESLDNASVIYLRTVDKNFKDGVDIQELTTKITLIITSDLILTIHRLDHAFLEDLRSLANSEMALKDLIKKIVLGTINTYDEQLIMLENRVDVFEEIIFEHNKSSNIIKEGYFLKRKASVIRKVLKFTMDIINALPNKHGFSFEDIQGLRENAETNLFYAEDALENVTGLLNLHISLAAQKTNEIMRVLTVFSIFFLPLNFLAGIYGMNFDNMPELKFEHGYYYLLAFMLSISLTIFIWFYKRGWLKRPE